MKCHIMKIMYFNYCFKKEADENGIKVIKSQIMRQAGHIAHGTAMKTAYNVLIG